MKKQPSDDIIKVIWGVIAMSKTHIDALDNSRKVLTNILADDLQETGEPTEDVRKEISEWVDEILWDSGGDASMQNKVDEALTKIGYAAERFNKSKETVSANS